MRTARLAALTLLFALSGAAALSFETLWQRMMVLVFGASAPATTAILTAFFLGIAVGSYLGGWLLRRVRRALLFYAGVELWIALWGLAVPWLLQAVDPIYLVWFRGEAVGTTSSLLLRFLLGVTVVLPATLGMGATVPVMNRLLVEARASVGGGVALAYGANTVGAVIGTMISGFVLVRYLGVTTALWMTAGTDLLIAVVALLLIRARCGPSEAGEGDRVDVDDRPSPSPLAESTDSRTVWCGRGLLACYLVSGFIALGLEITWFRLLALFTTSGTLSFALMLAVYLTGFAGGSLLLFPILARRLRAAAILALSSVGAGISAALLMPLCYRFGPLRERWLFALAAVEDLGLGRVVAVELGFTAALMLIPAAFLGLAYPALCAHMVHTRAETAIRSGQIYFVGTLGSMLGAAVTGLLLVPGIGMRGSLVLLSAAALVLGAVVLQLAGPGGRIERWSLQVGAVVAACAVLVLGASGPPFDPAGRLVRGTDRWEHPASPGPVAGNAPRWSLLRHKAGVSATVTVKAEHFDPAQAPFVRLYIDGQGVAGSSPDAQIDAKMLAHLPLLLHPAPHSALTVGFGSGGTSWSLTRHDIDAECVEIEPEVVRSAPLFLAQNHGVLDHPRFRLWLDDARDHLRTSGRSYDVISTDVTNIQYKQNGNLYTTDYFRLMRDRLNPGGVAAAWIPLGAITAWELRTLVRSFAEIFTHATLWYFGSSPTSFAILIGTPVPLTIDLDLLTRRMARPELARDLAEIGVTHPFQLVHFLLLDEKNLQHYAAEGGLHTDDHPVLEFSTPASFFRLGPLLENNLDQLRSLSPESLGSVVRGLGEADRALFSRHRLASLLWVEINALVVRAGRPLPHAVQIQSLERALLLARKADALVPPPPYRMPMSVAIQRMLAARKEPPETSR